MLTLLSLHYVLDKIPDGEVRMQYCHFFLIVPMSKSKRIKN